MLFVNALKDYIDEINYLSSLLDDNFINFIFLKSLVLYLLNSIKLGFLYLISFQWLTDFIELPAAFKQEYAAILEGKNVFSYQLETKLATNAFTFFDKSHFTSTNFLTGFSNSLFLSLPFSVPHLLTLRALIINGTPAGVSAAVGTFLGQTLFLGCILFGCEFIIVPFLNFGFLTFLLGLGLLINLVYKLIHQPTFGLFSVYQKNELLKLFGLNFFLAWTEQTCICGYLGNVTADGSPSLQITENSSGFLITQSIYFLGLIIGSIFWTFCFSWLVLQLRNQIANTIAINLSIVNLNKRIHYSILILTLVFSFNNIPYYGLDYIIYRPLGFLNNDKSLHSIQPKIHYYVADTGLQSSAVVNPIPFDKPAAKTNMDLNLRRRLKYEQYALDSERLWKQAPIIKFQDSAPLTSNNNAKVNILRNNEFKNPKVLDKYETPTLEKVSTKTNKEKVLDNFTKLCFRKDVYHDYLNLNSDLNLDFRSAAKRRASTHLKFRNKYYGNPVFKVLVNMDIHPFLAGQPKNYNLNAVDEFDLYQRRVILQEYINSINDYKEQSKPELHSYADKVYNQQFKGSLSVIRHFSSINMPSDFSLNIVIPNPSNEKTSNSETLLNETGKDKIKKVLRYDQQLYNEKPVNPETFLHEELKDTIRKKPFSHLRLNNSAPFYIGWDGSLRKFLIKTAVIPDTMMGGNSSWRSNNKTSFPRFFNFQAWGQVVERGEYSNDTLYLPCFEIGRNDSSLPGLQLRHFASLRIWQKSQKLTFESISTDKQKNYLIENFPMVDWYWNFNGGLLKSKSRKFNDVLNISKTLPPQFDGIAWPGNNFRKF